MLKQNSKSEVVSSIYFVTFRKIILEKKKASSCSLLFTFYFDWFYINKQSRDFEELENLARKPKYILLIKEMR